MLKGQNHSSNKSGLCFDKIVVSNITSTSKTVFVKPEVAEPQNACKDNGKAVIISCENADIKPVVPVMKAYLPSVWHHWSYQTTVSLGPLSKVSDQESRAKEGKIWH
jgi:hypothetical protein